MEELKSKEWVINRDTGLIFIVHSLMILPPSFSAYSPTEEEIVAGCKLTASAPVVALDGTNPEEPPVTPLGGSEVDLIRQNAIKTAVIAVLPENYGAAAFGRPAMPKVADVKSATGYADVTAEEIIAFLPITEVPAGA
jgi:hypothetical protein